jgi:hypothetical protein
MVLVPTKKCDGSFNSSLIIAKFLEIFALSVVTFERFRLCSSIVTLSGGLECQSWCQCLRTDVMSVRHSNGENYNVSTMCFWKCFDMARAAEF